MVPALSVAVAASLGTLNYMIPSHSDAVYDRKIWGPVESELHVQVG